MLADIQISCQALHSILKTEKKSINALLFTKNGNSSYLVFYIQRAENLIFRPFDSLFI
jgi:putative methionine-R-sulfoxide reductase with GAF domain